MRKHILYLISILIALDGCCAFPGGKRSYWVKRNYSAEEFKRDDYECRRDAQLRLGPLPGVASGALAIMTVGKYYYNECMQARGYELVEERDIPSKITQSTQQQLSTNDIPNSANEPYCFAFDVIKSLKICKNAENYLKTLNCNDIICFRGALLVLTHEFRQASTTLTKHRDSENNLIKESADKFCQGYTAITQNTENALSFFEQEVKQSQDVFSKQSVLSRQMSEYGAKNNESWKMLQSATVMATWALVGKAEAVDEKSASLTITESERDELRSQLRSAFGDQIVGGPKADQSAVDGLAGLLWAFLAKDWKPADTK